MSAVPTTPEIRAHALLGASKAKQWLNCPPSARLEETLPEAASTYADEGTLAHSIAELKLRKAFIEPMSAKAFNAKLKTLQGDPLYQPEMLTHTDVYIDYITTVANGYASKPYIAAEKKLDFSAWVPDGFGTGDCIIIGGNTLHVIDFKYGKGVPVGAEHNPQMMFYALGACGYVKMLYAISNITLTIVQPRLDSISEWSLTLDELLAWGEEIKPIAQQAYNGEGEYNPGDHCRFCRAKTTCAARAASYLALEDDYAFGRPLTAKEAFPDAPTLTPEQIAAAITRAEGIVSWLKDLETWALAECLSGGTVPGYKAVEGRSTRQFANMDAAFAALVNSGISQDMLYERKPITLTATEKLVGKAQFTTICGDYIIKPPGKPALAPDADPRPAITNKQSAAEVFGETISNENE
jgi:Protein of unknown function (DUF2800).